MAARHRVTPNMTLKPIPQPPAETEASVLYERATKGETAAVTELGNAYHFGKMGVAQNYRAAFHLYQRAVEDGDARAMWFLGSMYRGGYPFPPQDLAMARRLYEMAAEKGHRGGLLELADFCFRGVAGPIDLARSRQLFELAAESGSTGGMQRLAHLLDKGMGGPPDYGGAAQWYLRAALEGDAQAQHQLLSKWTSRWNTETRMAIQRRLREEGHYKGSIDGVLGEKTLAALRTFVGPIKPLVSKETLEALSRIDQRRKQRLT
jgi:hypothetical protein